VPNESHSTNDDDLTDEEVYAFKPGEAESAGTVTLPNGTVLGPSIVGHPENGGQEMMLAADQHVREWWSTQRDTAS
jgi:hypothetical protein